MADRVERTIRDMIPFAGQSTALIDACTMALISPNPDVAHLRDRIGALTHRRLAAAVGPDADPRVVRVLEASYSGALLTAGTGHRPFLDIPALRGGRGRAARGRGGRHGGRAHGDDDGRTPGSRDLQPVRLRHARGSLPDLCPPARRSAGVPERGVRLLGAVPARGRARRLPQRRQLLQLVGRVPRPVGIQPRGAPDHVLPGPRPAQAHPDALAGGQGVHAHQGQRHGGPHPRDHPRAPARPRSSVAPSTSSRTSPARCRWT